MLKKAQKGFTLAELLIALAILGVIATFTIPKILESSTNGKLVAIAKETASMISGAFTNYKANATPTSLTQPQDMTTYMNYVSTDVASTFQTPNQGVRLNTCSATLVCMNLHNGGVLQYDTGQSFGGVGATNALVFATDPDGFLPGAGGVNFFLFFNGRLSSGSSAGVTATGGTVGVATIATDPTYFSWN
jgi:prepilin-type N-terminal cleavage/methylation domain-containing protein